MTGATILVADDDRSMRIVLGRALGRLLDAESDCKRGGAPEATICARTLLEIGVNAPSRRRRRGGVGPAEAAPGPSGAGPAPREAR